jgi:hypothetical protein
MSDDRSGAEGAKLEFFLSYTRADREWAEWIGWQIQAAGWSVLVPDWRMVPGSNWAHAMAEGLEAERMIVVLSPDYLDSELCRAERWTAFSSDPLGRDRRVLVMRVAECARPDFLKMIVDVDLFGLPEQEARAALLDAIAQARRGRNEPAQEPPLPRSVPPAPRFPPSALQTGPTASFAFGFGAGVAAESTIDSPLGHDSPPTLGVTDGELTHHDDDPSWTMDEGSWHDSGDAADDSTADDW